MSEIATRKEDVEVITIDESVSWIWSNIVQCIWSVFIIMLVTGIGIWAIFGYTDSHKKGPPGPSGPPGAPGTNGIGIKGAKGDTGFNGEIVIGAKGIKGIMGALGMVYTYICIQYKIKNLANKMYSKGVKIINNLTFLLQSIRGKR
jgi:hypothetical protein